MNLRPFVLTLLAASLLSAAPLAITEPPDHPGSAGPTFVADLGLNTISGFVNGSPTGSDYEDNFSVFIPANLVVTSASVSILNFFNQGGAAGLGCFTGAGCFGTGGFFGLSLPAPGSTTSYTATSPWAGDQQGGVNLGAFDFTLNLQVAQGTTPVPEPATFLLVLPALAGLAALRRRRS
ncbi:MAG: PEP-CTERM sorting domain-containing protein [Acidobacteria bacterium]|nr:PEP-CTERM sorting domain-containing protein [Acidobacteriota bacterium]